MYSYVECIPMHKKLFLYFDDSRIIRDRIGKGYTRIKSFSIPDVRDYVETRVYLFF